jgi:hypothetical protein
MSAGRLIAMTLQDSQLNLLCGMRSTSTSDSVERVASTGTSVTIASLLKAAHMFSTRSALCAARRWTEVDGMTKTPDEIKKGLECKKRVFADSCYDRCATCELFIPCYGTVERCADALALIHQLEAELEDMTTRYKIADDCAKKKGEMNEKLYAELSAVKAERDAAVAALKSNCVCYECKWFDDDLLEGHCNDCNYENSSFKWRGVQKEVSE